MMKEQVYQKEKLNEVVMRMYAERIIPDNPLYNDPDYAKKTWYKGLPIIPGYVEALAMAMLPRELGDNCMPDRQLPGDAYDHEVQYFAPILAGDKLENRPGPVDLIDITPKEGSIVRCFVLIAQADIINQRGETVGRSITRFPNFRCRLKPGMEPDEFIHPFNRYMHPAHHYTDEDYAFLKDIWEKEIIRGPEVRYWDDVQIGDHTGTTAEPPFTQMDMIRMYGQELVGTVWPRTAPSPRATFMTNISRTENTMWTLPSGARIWTAISTPSAALQYHRPLQHRRSCGKMPTMILHFLKNGTRPVAHSVIYCERSCQFEAIRSRCL